MTDTAPRLTRSEASSVYLDAPLMRASAQRLIEAGLSTMPPLEVKEMNGLLTAHLQRLVAGVVDLMQELGVVDAGALAAVHVNVDSAQERLDGRVDVIGLERHTEFLALSVIALCNHVDVLAAER